MYVVVAAPSVGLTRKREVYKNAPVSVHGSGTCGITAIGAAAACFVQHASQMVSLVDGGFSAAGGSL